jgi:hypothetical protein
MTDQVPGKTFPYPVVGEVLYRLPKYRSSLFLQRFTNLGRASRSLPFPNARPKNGIVVNEPFVKYFRVLFLAPREHGILDVHPPSSQ